MTAQPLPLAPPHREAFNAQVWAIARQIPYGHVATYGQIAQMLAPPPGTSEPDYRAFGARWVGYAMANCPPDVPWQRVINSQGKISLRSGAGRQRELLEDEGVEFDERERIDLAKYRWSPPSAFDPPRLPGFE